MRINEGMPEVDPQKHLTTAKTLASSSFYNLLGQGFPIIAAIISIPLIIKGLGTERFGALALVWMFIGYFSVFDFGLGRALTKLVAEKFGQNKENEVPALFWTAIFLMAVMGLLGGGILWSLSHWLVYDVLEVTDLFKLETLKSFYIIASVIPIITTATGLRGVLEARQEFKAVNIIRVGVGLLTYLGPLGALAVSTDLHFIVFVLVTGRVMAWFGYLLFCCKKFPFILKNRSFDKGLIRPLLSFGGWMTAANIVGPLMVNSDRFLIGSLLSVSMVAYYTTPYDMVTKLWILPGALIGVLLPAFSTTFANDREQAIILFRRSIKYIFTIMFPACLLLIVYSFDLLNIWINEEFAKNSHIVMNVIVFGVFVNSMAQVCFVLLQAVGRPDVTLKILLVQIPFYFTLLYFFTKKFGIEGAAFAWSIRVLADTALFFYYTKSIVLGAYELKVLYSHPIVFCFASFVISLFVEDFFLKSAVYLFLVTVFLFLMLRQLEDEEKKFTFKFLKKLGLIRQ